MQMRNFIKFSFHYILLVDQIKAVREVGHIARIGNEKFIHDCSCKT
jgi:hypothetical protein